MTFEFFWFQLSVSECFDNEDFFDLFFLYRWDLGVLLSLLNQHSRSVYTTQNQITGTWDIISCGLSKAKSRIFVRIRHFQSKFANFGQNRHLRQILPMSVKFRDFQSKFDLWSCTVFDWQFSSIFDKNTVFSKSDNFLKICKSRDLECRKDM